MEEQPTGDIEVVDFALQVTGKSKHNKQARAVKLGRCLDFQSGSLSERTIFSCEQSNQRTEKHITCICGYSKQSAATESRIRI